jgi:mRNA interferase MazF
LVISINEINALPLVVTVVVGTKGSSVLQDYPTNVRVAPKDSGLPLETVFLCFQIRALDPKRFITEPVGMLSEEKMADIETSIRYCLGL